jgi:hypothetical protein
MAIRPLALRWATTDHFLSPQSGVMRFLQIEWHNHERARNTWDIERAEMKQKIAKMQGENNHLKRNVQVLEKHVKMLEKVVLNERTKQRSATTASADKLPSEDKEAMDLETNAAMKNLLKNGNTSPCPAHFPPK